VSKIDLTFLLWLVPLAILAIVDLGLISIIRWLVRQ
jgi:hypothetical protein